MKTTLMTILAFVISVAPSCISAQTGSAKSSDSADKEETKEKVYDGDWWARAEPNERSGFLQGAADCIVWTAHTKLPRDIDNLEEKIGQYYKTHPNDRNVAVSTIWQKVSTQGPPATPRPTGGEVYTNPHGFHDGFWWRQGPESENRGFLEGYLWCMRTCVNQPSETYSQPISYYFDKIWDYIFAHPKAEHDAVANILARFRDRPKRK
jgi:hypothetical protein